VAGGVPEGAGPPEISLPALTNRILQTSPGIRNHPEVLLAALERAAPMLDRQGKEDLAEAKNKFTEQRLELAKDALREAQRNHDMQNQGRTRAADQRDIREARLATGAQVRQDQAYQRLFVQQQALQAKVAQTNNANDIKKLHEITQAMHNRATDILKANNQFTTLSDEDKASLKAEQDKFYEDQKARIEKVTGVPPPDFGSRFDAAKPSGVPSSQPAAAAAAPPPVAIPPQILQDAQSAIAKGAPRAAVIKRLQEQGYPTDGL
jgi:hypothetical protein